MKKLLFCTLLSGFITAGIVTPFEAEAKKGHGHVHYKKYKPSRVYIAPSYRYKKIYIPRQKVYVAPRYYQPRRVYTTPRVITYGVPLVSYNPGNFYFRSSSPAYISARQARAKGYRTNVYFSNNNWTLIIR